MGPVIDGADGSAYRLRVMAAFNPFPLTAIVRPNPALPTANETVIVLVPAPEVIVAPEGTVQLYPVVAEDPFTTY